MNGSTGQISQAPAMRVGPVRPDGRLLAAFFVSGCPALLYQLVWQRALFSLYGVNIEAITVVVAAFMLGLGLGSWLGGALSRLSLRPLSLFAGFEVAIGLFGLGSLPLFRWVGSQSAGADTFHTGVLVFGLVLLPTCLMGATLPLLVTHLVERARNVGHSLGVLYFVNTLGSASACFLAAWLLLPYLGMQGSVTFAAVINLGVGVAALTLDKRDQRVHPAAATQSSRTEAAPSLAAATRTRKPEDVGAALPFSYGLALSAATGFTALSYEILWSRVFAFASGGSAYNFPLLLGTYLAGIAFGSRYAGKACSGSADGPRAQLRRLALVLLSANLLAFLVAPTASMFTPHLHYSWTLPLMGLAAAGLGATFPLLGHACVRPDSLSGTRISYLYLANIVGSTAGCLLTGFVLLDAFSLYEVSVAIASVGVLTAALTGLGMPKRSAARGWASAALGATATLVLGGFGYQGLYERLLRERAGGIAVGRFTEVVENKHGVVAVSADGTVYGGGVYDGVFNVDLVHDRNLLVRPFALGAFHQRPRRVLSIGLASGSWAQVLIHHPDVEQLTVIEINPGYLPLVKQHESVASLLDNPKLELVIDDGRRWLLANPDRRFDALVMNTTFHWRSQSTNLLSGEFLSLVRRHLEPGGVTLLNTTGSGNVYRTVLDTFPHVYRFYNAVVASDAPLSPDRARWERQLRSYRIDRRPVFDLPREELALQTILGSLDRMGPPESARLEDREQLLRRTAHERSITDDNMATEWRR
jgi:spermidine synthase